MEDAEKTYEITESQINELLDYFNKSLSSFSNEDLTKQICRQPELMILVSEVKGIKAEDVKITWKDGVQTPVQDALPELSSSEGV